MQREMERHDCERRKEEERLMRERQREEERFQREQRRELEWRDGFLQKETIRAEKMRQREELRKEKEAARLKAANERATARRIAKEFIELIEDECLELMDLAVSNKRLPSILSLDSDTLLNLHLFRGQVRLNRGKLLLKPNMVVSRIGGELPVVVKRYYEPAQSMSEFRAIAFVEAQLGETVREDGLILGMEFDPLPPGAFGAPLGTYHFIILFGTAIMEQQTQAVRSYEGKIYEHSDNKAIKVSSNQKKQQEIYSEVQTLLSDMINKREKAMVTRSCVESVT